MVFDIIASLCAAPIILAYFLLEKGIMTKLQPSYQLLNLVGAMLILLTLLWQWNLAVFVIELSWAVISAYGLVKALQVSKRGI